MSMTDFRALCAELSELDGHCVVDCTEEWADAMCRLRAALAQPEPVAPTDQEIEEWADACPEAPLEEMDPEVHGWRRCFTTKEFSETIRAALSRWGRPTPQPVAVSERLPGPEDCTINPRTSQGQWCWGGVQHGPAPYSGRWRMMRREWLADEATHWLPANALPTPEANDS